MAGTTGPLLPAVIKDLAKHPRKYSFDQLIRLLRLWARPKSRPAWEALLRARVRLRPTLSLGFAATDVDALELHPAQEGEDSGCPFALARVTASFLGLYGPSSPLPTFYTERLLDEEAEDLTVTRDFLDIFNNSFFFLYCKLTSMADPVNRALEEADPRAERMLMSLGGFGAREMRDRLHDEFACLRYAGLFSQFPRSALGLRTILADASGCAEVRVVQHVPRLVPVPPDQRARLGLAACSLGEDLVLGREVPCHDGKIRVEFAGLDRPAMRALMPGAPSSLLLHDLIRNYCAQPLEYEVRLVMRPGAAQPLRPGGNKEGCFATLGHDAWLGNGGLAANGASGQGLGAARAFFPAGYAPGRATRNTGECHGKRHE